MPRSLLVLRFALASASIGSVSCTDRLPSPEPEAPAESGERLKMRRYVAEGGASSTVSIVDSKFGHSCHLLPTADGATRCMPLVGSIYYRDAGCTEPVAVIDSDSECDQADVFTRLVFSGCGEWVATAYRAAEALPEVSRLFSGDSGLCLETQVTGTVHAVVPVDPEEFVAGTWTQTPRPGGITVSRFVGDDGSHIIEGWIDDERGQPCGPGTIGGSRRCVPVDVADTRSDTYPSFGDAQCSTPVGLQYLADACEPAAVLHEGRYYEVGDELDRAFVEFEGTCTALPENLSGYTLGTPIPDDSFPPLTEVVEGEGRIVATWDADADGGLVSPRARFSDAQSGLPCFFMRDTDDTLRCLPDAGDGGPGAHAWLYADPACSERLVFIPGPAVPPYVAETEPDPCGFGHLSAVFEVDEPYDGSEAWIWDEGECVGGSRPDGGSLHRVTEVDPSALAPIEAVVD